MYSLRADTCSWSWRVQGPSSLQRANRKTIWLCQKESHLQKPMKSRVHRFQSCWRQWKSISRENDKSKRDLELSGVYGTLVLERSSVQCPVFLLQHFVFGPYRSYWVWRRVYLRQATPQHFRHCRIGFEMTRKCLQHRLEHARTHLCVIEWNAAWLNVCWKPLNLHSCRLGIDLVQSKSNGKTCEELCEKTLH